MLSILIMMRAHDESKHKSIRGLEKMGEKREASRKRWTETHRENKRMAKLAKDRKSYEVIEERAEIVEQNLS